MSDDQPPSRRPSWDDLDQFFAGDADAAPRARVDAYFAAHPHAEEALRRYVAGPHWVWSVDNGFEELRTRIVAAHEAVAESQPTPHWLSSIAARRLTPRWQFAVATLAACAIVVVAILTGISWWTTPARRITETPTVYDTHNGQRAEIVLPDGSTVTLNVASQLIVPKNFGGSTRTLQLSGEAFFRVAHTTQAPFIVRAAGTETRVLGTEFSVRAYDTTQVQVAVRDGRVAFNQTVLSARDIATIGLGSPIAVQHDQNLSAMFDFTTGHLVLNDVRLRDAIPDLDRWYDANIQLTDPSLGNRSLHAVLPGGSIGDLIDLLNLTFNVRIVRTGHTLAVYPH